MNILVFLGACVAVATAHSYESLEISDEFVRQDSSSEEYEQRGAYQGGYYPIGREPETVPQPPGTYDAPYPRPDYEPVPLPPAYPYPYPPGSNYDFQKLKTLRGDNIVKAKLRYYKKDNQNFVVISCPRNPTPGSYTWILADSKHRASPSFGISETVALAAGLNVEFIAKLNLAHQKWEGRDLTNDDKQRFRRVGCLHGATQSFIKN